MQEHMVRLSLKLFNITPDQLPDGLRDQVVGLVTADPVGGSVALADLLACVW